MMISKLISWLTSRIIDFERAGFIDTAGFRAGAWLPDTTVTCGGRRVRLHDLIARSGFTVLLDRHAQAPPLPPAVPVHRLSDQRGTGIRVIRPDGYIGYRSAVVNPRRLELWLDRLEPSPDRSADIGPGALVSGRVAPGRA